VLPREQRAVKLDKAMRTLCLAVLLVLCACSRKQVSDTAVESETAPASIHPIQTSVSVDSPRPIGRTIDSYYGSSGLLIVEWSTSEDYDFSLILTPDGYLTHIEELPLHRWVKFRRYYPDEEAEKLFDSLMPLIEKHAIKTAVTPGNHYSVSFAYQTTDGAFVRRCIIPDLEPITALLAKLEAGGQPEAPVGHPPVQTWARKRFDRFLPMPSPLEADPAAALQIKGELGHPLSGLRKHTIQAGPKDIANKCETHNIRAYTHSTGGQ
jgi:hypothetical protein